MKALSLPSPPTHTRAHNRRDTQDAHTTCSALRRSAPGLLSHLSLSRVTSALFISIPIAEFADPFNSLYLKASFIFSLNRVSKLLPHSQREVKNLLFNE